MNIELEELHYEVNVTTAPLKGTGKNMIFSLYYHKKTKDNSLKIDVLPFWDIVYSPDEFMINSINLYQSVLVLGGSQYTLLNKFPLN